MWRARCAIAEVPLDLARAFPGVQCCSPGQVRSERRSHPLRKGANGGLLGSVFADNSGKTWCVEELATDGAGCQVGIYAYDTARWASAALRLDERCTFFGQEVLEEVERQQEATARAVADFWGGCGLAEGSLDERLRWQGGGSRPAHEVTPQLGSIEVGKTGPDEVRAGWKMVYVGGNAAARQRMPEGEALRNPWRLVNSRDGPARSAMCAMCDELTRDPI